MAQTPGPMQHQSGGSFGSAQLPDGGDGLFACDDPSLVAQYMQSFPPLQPTPIQGVQPSTSGQGMVYPESPLHAQYLASNPQATNATGLGIQGNSPLANPLALGTDNAIKIESPVMAHQAPFARMPPQYDMLRGYGASDPPMDGSQQALTVDRQAKPDLDDVNPHQRTAAAKRGKFMDPAVRERTAYTRRIGSCIRCRMQRIRVRCSPGMVPRTRMLTQFLQCNMDPENPDGPCATCKKVATNRVWRLSCLRWKITDVRLYKPGQVKGHEWTNRWKDSVVDDIGSWAASDTRTIRVTEGYTGKSIELRVRRFQPQDGDRLDRSWVSRGVKRSVPIPPYAIIDMEAAKSSFDHYIKTGLVGCCRKLLGSKEKLLWKTYDQAMKVMQNPATDEKEKGLINSTLDLWMSVRLTTKSFEIVGHDTLGMPRDLINDSENALNGKIPLPPVMGAQIDSVLIHQIQPVLRRKTLEELQKMTQEKKQKTWLTTYIVTFILLHNIALITKHDAEYARKHGMKVSLLWMSSFFLGKAHGADIWFLVARRGLPEKTR
jgi:hypothetical protein